MKMIVDGMIHDLVSKNIHDNIKVTSSAHELIISKQLPALNDKVNVNVIQSAAKPFYIHLYMSILHYQKSSMQEILGTLAKVVAAPYDTLIKKLKVNGVVDLKMTNISTLSADIIRCFKVLTMIKLFSRVYHYRFPVKRKAHTVANDHPRPAAKPIAAFHSHRPRLQRIKTSYKSRPASLVSHHSQRSISLPSASSVRSLNDPNSKMTWADFIANDLRSEQRSFQKSQSQSSTASSPISLSGHEMNMSQSILGMNISHETSSATVALQKESTDSINKPLHSLAQAFSKSNDKTVHDNVKKNSYNNVVESNSANSSKHERRTGKTMSSDNSDGVDITSDIKKHMSANYYSQPKVTNRVVQRPHDYKLINSKYNSKAMHQILRYAAGKNNFSAAMTAKRLHINPDTVTRGLKILAKDGYLKRIKHSHRIRYNAYYGNMKYKQPDRSQIWFRPSLK